VKWARREKSSAGFHFLGTGGVTVDAQAFSASKPFLRVQAFSASMPKLFRVQPLRGNKPHADAALAMRSGPCITPAGKADKAIANVLRST
jgi:hypothetical protein